jgi:AmmeMemoRadiSam system protein A
MPAPADGEPIAGRQSGFARFNGPPCRARRLQSLRMLLSPQHHRTLLDAARGVIRAALAKEPPPVADTDDPDLLQPAGCFVTLHEQGTHRLRGCIGRLDASEPLIHAVRGAAAGVLEDPRFAGDPVRLDELPNLEIELSILSPLRPAADPLDFDLLNDGIHLRVGGRSGCFLPQVARETGWTKGQLLARLCTEKMGMPPDAWRLEGASLEVFSTLLVGPEPF